MYRERGFDVIVRLSKEQYLNLVSIVSLEAQATKDPVDLDLSMTLHEQAHEILERYDPGLHGPIPGALDCPIPYPRAILN